MVVRYNAAIEPDHKETTILGKMFGLEYSLLISPQCSILWLPTKAILPSLGVHGNRSLKFQAAQPNNGLDIQVSVMIPASSRNSKNQFGFI